MRTPTALAVSMLASLALVAPALAEKPPTGSISLALGDSRFWLGGQIDSGDVSDPSLCDVVAPCPAFELHLAGGGNRLRVAYDTPARTNSFELELTSPSGETTKADGSNVFNAEAFVDKPAAG